MNENKNLSNSLKSYNFQDVIITEILTLWNLNETNGIINPQKGIIIFNIINNELYYYNETIWQTITLGSVTENYVIKSGDTMRDELIISNGGLNITGNSTFQNNITINRALNSDSITVSSLTNNSNETIAGTLSVAGNSLLNSLSTNGLVTLNSVTVTGSESIGGILSVTGNTTLSETLNSGATTITSLTNHGNENITGSLSVGRNVALTSTSNQLVLGNTNTVTVNSVAPTANRIYTIPDTGANSSFIMSDSSSQTITRALHTNALFSNNGIVDNVLSLNSTSSYYIFLQYESGNGIFINETTPTST